MARQAGIGFPPLRRRTKNIFYPLIKGLEKSKLAVLKQLTFPAPFWWDKKYFLNVPRLTLQYTYPRLPLAVASLSIMSFNIDKRNEKWAWRGG
jgi:hypothetical protein